tara:strand:+ start:429 stop:578 length:150 start_codon:yes stop_codon:yes gene_type:complete
MRGWLKILPYFVVIYIAKRYGERFNTNLNGKEIKIVSTFKGTYIKVDDV